MDIVQELELYLKKTQLDAVVRELMVDALSSRSEDPLQFLLRWILEKNAGLSSPKVAVASDASVHVAISHPDPSTQKVAEQKPDNVLSFLAVQAHNLHKSPPASLTGP
ncbi:uncharacterized protein HaLaN_06056 [Haematococcus lacustris]|uniref:Uncharacterized protein n=1 Tax=Haematococcus lacustris TaxID=44745 RepID=A0A699YKE2_HAELA|nr:uncharacterized protein HaLaN_06056 [Haematococcus lacustris]